MSRVLPILFNTEMVRAILDGQKTVTRRLGKKIPKETHRIEPLEDWTFECHWGGYQPDTGAFCDGSCVVNPPYQPGDILYVRESFCPNYFDKNIAVYRGDRLKGNRNAYKADYNKAVVGDVVPEPKWHPSIHMPKAAARIWLKVKEVRVERLQDIDDDGGVAEGLPSKWGNFDEIWNSTINKKDFPLYGWDANPWVWVIEFERCEKPESEASK